MPYLVRKKIDGTVINRTDIQDKAIVFGRSSEADVQINDDRMSRQHFAVTPRDGEIHIQDLKSTNGTWVNGTRITESILKPNDRIRAGQTVMVYELTESKGLATIMGELSQDQKDFRSQLGEIAEAADQVKQPRLRQT